MSVAGYTSKHAPGQREPMGRLRSALILGSEIVSMATVWNGEEARLMSPGDRLWANEPNRSPDARQPSYETAAAFEAERSVKTREADIGPAGTQAVAPPGPNKPKS